MTLCILKKGPSLFLLAFLLSTASLMAQEMTTSVYLIRHSEKVRSNPSDKNPHLNEKGKERAQTWKKFFKHIPLAAVYSTPYNRTQETAAPTAADKGITVESYHPVDVNLDSIVAIHQGHSILLVGHSNTIPLLTNKLIGRSKYPQLDDRDNASLFIVQVDGNETNVVRIKVETP